MLSKKSRLCVGKVWMDCCCSEIPEGNDRSFYDLSRHQTSQGILSSATPLGRCVFTLPARVHYFSVLFLFVITSVPSLRALSPKYFYESGFTYPFDCSTCMAQSNQLDVVMCLVLYC
ncbi:hypothetical protein TNCT_160911 [Trichonephila clavata]|uniref:Uncharacterized protein n=1 Tax=Trichonephila clavata TaxID=2740835 RepID=A0A8X6FAG0_TRICU|nr:hypothetical protein TNCT_15411 [Trichonephila clavata]GFQ81926.1 hypothetical protein TNCT_160911 [Trichonephila clavata]